STHARRARAAARCARGPARARDAGGGARARATCTRARGLRRRVLGAGTERERRDPGRRAGGTAAGQRRRRLEDLRVLAPHARVPRRRHRREPRHIQYTSGPVSATATPTTVLRSPAVAIARSAHPPGRTVTMSAPARPPGTTYGLA